MKTVKIDHVQFTCNWFIVLRKWAQRYMLLQKRCFENTIKFQHWKITIPQLFFNIATLIRSKLWKFSDQGKSIFIHWSGEMFPFPLTFPDEGCSCAAQLHHVRKWSFRFVQEVVKYSRVSHRLFQIDLLIIPFFATLPNLLQHSPFINFGEFCQPPLY